MRWLMTMILAAMSFSSICAAPQLADERPEDVRAIRAHIDSIFRAYIEEDRDTVRATHSEDWRGFLRPSRSVIRGIDEYMRTAEAALSGPYGLVGYEFVEFDIVFYGDTALINYVARLEPGSVPFRPMIRVLDVYERIDGHWIQVASQTAPHPDTLAARRQNPSPVSGELREEILDAREAVWRAWFDHDRDGLVRMIPEETIAINADQDEWRDRDGILQSAAAFERNNGKLLHLEFPRTEIRLYGDVAVLYTSYLMETEIDGQAATQSGRGTEIFVRRDGGWVNSGWHLDSGR